MFVLPVVLRLYRLEPEDSVVRGLIVVVFFPFAVQIFSSLSPDFLKYVGSDDPRMLGGVSFQ